ncbi:MAG: choice-of-anchor D domain-containing protein [Anaerolineae bacterium]
MVSSQLDLSQQIPLRIQDNYGQIAVGNYVVQIGSVHGGVVNVTMPEEQPAWQPRPGPVLLRPRRFSGLLDRHPETEAALAALRAAQPLEFYGAPGWGKTSLLRHLAYTLPNVTCPDGIVFLTARQQPLADLRLALFEAFYESAVPGKPTETHLRHALQTKKALIFLDDLDLDRAEVEVMLNTAPESMFVLASPERRLWGEGQVLPLQGLPPAETTLLLERELARPLSAAEEAAARQLGLLLAGHPLHLLQAAAFTREHNLSLEELTRLIGSDDPPAALANRALLALSPPERRVLGVLAVFGGAPVSAEHLAALTGLSDPASLVESLLQRKLIQAHSPRYTLAGNLAQHWPAAWDVNALAERSLTYFIGWAEQHQRQPQRFLTESEAIRSLLARAAQSQRWPEILRLVRASEGSLALNGRWAAWEQILNQAGQAAEALGDRAAQAWTLHQLGTRALCLGDSSAAQVALSRALRLRQTLGDRAGAAVTRHNLSHLTLPPLSGGSDPGNGPAPRSGGEPLIKRLLAIVRHTPLALTGGVIAVLMGLMIFLGGLFAFQPAPAPTAAPALVFVTMTPEHPVPPTPVTAATPTHTAIVAAIAETPTSTPTPTLLAASPLPPTLSIPDTPTPIVVVLASSPTFTPSPTLTPLPIATPTFTRLPTVALWTPSPTFTPTPTPTNTGAPTSTATRTLTTTPTQVTPTFTPTPTPTFTPSPTSTVATPTFTPTPTFTASPTSTPTFTPSPTSTPTFTVSPTSTPTFTPSSTPSATPTRVTPTFTASPTSTPTFTPSATSTRVTPTFTPTPTQPPSPQIFITPFQLDFGRQPLQTTSQPQTVFVVNLGPATLLIRSVTLTGANPGDYNLADHCTGLNLRQADFCTLDVRFAPITTGLRQATLLINDNATGSLHQVSLSGSGLDQPSPPDVVADVDAAGPVFVNENGQAVAPIVVIVRNQGQTPAAVFKVTTQYTGGLISPGSTFVVAFTAQPSTEVDPAGGFYPFTRQPLPPGGEVTFIGQVTFNPAERGVTVSLSAEADSCSGEESTPAFCRVAESNEGNNVSASIPLLLPPLPPVD